VDRMRTNAVNRDLEAASVLGAPSKAKRIECLQGSRIGTLNRNLFTRYLSGLELPSRIKLTCNQLLLQPF